VIGEPPEWAWWTMVGLLAFVLLLPAIKRYLQVFPLPVRWLSRSGFRHERGGRSRCYGRRRPARGCAIYDQPHLDAALLCPVSASTALELVVKP
jgi:hypothetical protein